MAHQGSQLTAFNLEMVKSLEELHQAREELSRRIEVDQAEQAKIESDLEVLTRRLQQINASLAKKTTMRCQYDKVIQQTEEALSKIVESSQALVLATKRSAGDIAKLAGQVDLGS